MMNTSPESLRQLIEQDASLTRVQARGGLLVARAVLSSMAEYGHPESQVIALAMGAIHRNGTIGLERHKHQWIDRPDGPQTLTRCLMHCWSYAIDPSGDTYVLSPSGNVQLHHAAADVFPKTGEAVGLARSVSMDIEGLALYLRQAPPDEDPFNGSNLRAREHVVTLMESDHTILNPIARVAIQGIVDSY
jgi:hypothetical protein